MLAYVFRHWAKLDVPNETYEGALLAFHAALRDAILQPAPPGTAENPLVASTLFRVRHAPWLPAGRTGYEDWYLLQDSAAIDTLNDAAVSGERRTPHDHAAGLAQAGLGALYRLIRGEVRLKEVAQAVWFSKPRGASYEALYQRLEPWLAVPETGLWRRQMVLGPPPEFGLVGPAVKPLPADLLPIAISLERL